MNFKIKKMMVAVDYALTVDDEIFLKIIDKDDQGSADETQLFEKLMELDGISGVDWHYGPQLYVTLDPKYDIPSTWFAVYKIMDDYVKSE